MVCRRCAANIRGQVLAASPQPRRSPRPRPWDETLNRWLIDTQEQHPALSALAFFLVFLCLVYVQVRYICPTKPPHGAPFPEW